MDPILQIILILAGVIAGIIIAVSVLKLHPAIALLLAAVITGLLLGFSFISIGEAIFTGFRNVVAGVGVVIILGAVLGTLMEHSGAMDSIIGFIIRIFGNNRPATSLSVLGLVIGIPVFCDSGFIILSRVANGIADQKNLPRRITATALAGGLYTAHTLIPPTPGPVAAAGNLGMSSNLGLILASGMMVSIPILIVLIGVTSFQSGKFNKQVSISTEHLPTSRWVLLLPVIIAMALIAAGSVLSVLYEGDLPALAAYIFHPAVALLAASIIAWVQIKKDIRSFNLIKKGIGDALPIVLITGMGGAFGQILKESSLTGTVSDIFGASGGGAGHLLLIGFIGAFIIKTAQGSSTAAIVITSSILFPLTGDMSGWQLALLISSIGSGAMAISHANDSYFWVVTKFSGITVKEGYRYFSMLTILLAVTGFVTCWLLNYIV